MDNQLPVFQVLCNTQKALWRTASLMSTLPIILSLTETIRSQNIVPKVPPAPLFQRRNSELHSNEDFLQEVKEQIQYFINVINEVNASKKSKATTALVKLSIRNSTEAAMSSRDLDDVVKSDSVISTTENLDCGNYDENTNEISRNEPHSNANTLTTYENELTTNEKELTSDEKVLNVNGNEPIDEIEVILRSKNVKEKEKDFGKKMTYKIESLNEKESNNNSKQEIVQKEILQMMDVDHLLLIENDSNKNQPSESSEYSSSVTETELIGASPAALIVHSLNSFQNDLQDWRVFMATYFTILTHDNLLEAVYYRLEYFENTSSLTSNNAFRFLAEIIANIISSELNNEIIQFFASLPNHFLIKNNAIVATMIKEKLEEFMIQKSNENKVNHLQMSLEVVSLIDFKSFRLVEQLTLLDFELFRKIDNFEYLIWSQQENYDRSPNLFKFIQHFNSVSYWFQTLLVQAENGTEREYFGWKIIKMLKHLRKINNFSSYMALLSALGSSSINKLGWSKSFKKEMHVLSELINDSRSFHTYRQALTDATGSCIPYIGLLMQDLLAVKMRNKNFLPCGYINFSRRFLQYKLLVPLLEHKSCWYNYEADMKIQSYFNNFQDYLDPSTIWVLAKKIADSTQRPNSRPLSSRFSNSSLSSLFS